MTDSLHGVELVDPYRWLEDQQSPETRAWIDRQNAYTDQVLGDLPEKQVFANRLEALLNTDDVKTPEIRNGRAFFTRRPVGASLYAIYMREGVSGQDQLLIDPTSWSAKQTTNVGVRDLSDDGKLLAYYVREGGADEVEIRFFDVDTRRDVGTPLPRARYYGLSTTPTREYVYFSRMGKEGPRVFRRRLTGGDDEQLFGTGLGREKIVNADLAGNGRYLLIHVLHGSAPTRVDIFLDDLTDSAPPRTVVNETEINSTARVAGDQLVIETNWDAPNGRVMIAPLANPERANWRVLIPENPNAALESTTLAGGRVFAKYLENVRPRFVGYDLSGTKRDDLSFPTLGQLDDMEGSWSSPVAFFRFSSFHVPGTIYAYDVPTSQRSVFARVDAPVNPDDFQLEQVWYTSKDGTRIPMFVLSKKGLRRDGSARAFLTGYGGFSSNRLPQFTPMAIAWVEQGGVYALPNLRGGGEFGERWHRAGMLEQRQNVFDDFIGAAEHLVRERYTSPRHITVFGRSNGGLLVMAMATQRPDLVGAVICGYPLIDMLRYHRFLVGSFWVPEYGSGDNPQQFPFIRAYSPYHRVAKGTRYPATYFYTGDNDTRVAPLHARKMTALMQSAQGGDDPIVLRYDTTGGHSSGEPLHVQVASEAERLAFAWRWTE